jgi:hypothetical protein
VEHVQIAVMDIVGALFLNTAAAIYEFNTSPKRECLFCREANRLDGVIGSNLMRLAVWRIDYAEKNIIITDNRTLLEHKELSIFSCFF